MTQCLHRLLGANRRKTYYALEFSMLLPLKIHAEIIAGSDFVGAI